MSLGLSIFDDLRETNSAVIWQEARKVIREATNLDELSQYLCPVIKQYPPEAEDALFITLDILKLPDVKEHQDMMRITGDLRDIVFDSLKISIPLMQKFRSQIGEFFIDLDKQASLSNHATQRFSYTKPYRIPLLDPLFDEDLDNRYFDIKPHNLKI